MPRDAGSGGHEENKLENREWLLRCQGWRVYGPEGTYIGIVVEVLYGFSHRWDRPQSLKIRNGPGQFDRVGIEAVGEVNPGRESLRLL